MKRFLFIGLFTLYLSSAVAQTIDSDLSKVEFTIGNMGFMSVSGTLTGMEGNLVFDKNNLENAYFDVVIDPTSISTNNKKRDQHLKEEDFFNVATYLTIRFVSSEIIHTSDGYLAKGDLTLRGITKSIGIPFTVSDKNEVITLQGETSVVREDYQLGTGKYGGNFIVGSSAEIKITCILKR